MTAPSDRDARRLELLAKLVKQRRIALGFSSKEKAADACDLSHMTYRHVEAARPVSDLTYAKIETTFEFVPDSCKAVLAGADSVKLLDGTELISGGQISHPSLDALTDELKQAITAAARLTAPNLTLGQTDEMTEAVVKELQRRGILPQGQ